MTKKTSNVQETKPIAYDALLYPVFDADYEDEEEEVIGYECMSCGNIQGKKNGFGCDRCSAPLTEWYG